jgi:hypothetical protein
VSDRSRSLQIEEDLTFQRHQVRFERIGWAVMALLLIAALLGLLGSGPLGTTTAGDADSPIRVRYGRLERKDNATSLSVTVDPAAIGAGQVRLWLDAAWAESFVIESIVPEPESVEVGPDRLAFVFAAEAGHGPVEIIFHVRYERWGWQRGAIGLDGGPTLRLPQFIYP